MRKEENTEYQEKELRSLLAHWQAPASPQSLDARALASFRQLRPRTPWGRKLFTASIRVPLPVAAALTIFAVAAALWALRSPQAVTITVPQALPSTVQIVEVPVVQERVVTRTIYANRTQPRPKGVDHTASAHPDANNAPVQNNGAANLIGFKPPEEMKIRIIRKANTDEDN